jgi:hypothetical protein
MHRALKGLAKVECVRKDGTEKLTESKMLEVIKDISVTLDMAHRLQQIHSSDR